ncbi:SMI1/KNR4 family protein [Corallococcus sp. AB045]|uniref:SMI1/KNR4 family protein n=1 Tax=Corallococcus sp. AB045 TaxID=2316719 RepID=UPI000EE4036A|nr:SMI1/KNR4 family protein [Corallococcus sp. AB045]RKH90596.1 SMI1/KNR4 family protein [Corallococcus sp. AB045]
MRHFLEYVSSLDPQFTSRIRGARPEQIAAFEKLVGRSLPESYRSFLEMMGRDDGGLNITVDGTANISDLIDYYQEELKPGDWEPPPDTIIIGVGAISLPEIGLLCATGAEPRVIFATNKQALGAYATSLEKLLCRIAFDSYRMSKKPRAFYTSSYESIGRKHVLTQARALMVSFGFVVLEFSDDFFLGGEMPGAAISVSQYEKQGMALSITATRQEEVDRIGAAFVQGLGVRKA